MRASDRAYAALREEIVDWTLPPGTVLGEVEQAARLGVSRTPLREALARLSADGLVASQAGRGLVVTDIAAADIRELFELRRALEEQAVRLAAARRDPEVFAGLEVELAHAAELLDDPARRAYYALVARVDEAVDSAAGSRYLQAALRGMRTHLDRVRRFARDDAERLRAAAREHLLIVRAIRDGDAELAVAATRVHLSNALANVLAGAPERPHAAAAS